MKKINLGGVFDAVECITSSTFSRNDQYSDSIIVNAENAALNKYTVQGGRSKYV